MSNFTIEVQDEPAHALLRKLASRVDNMQPVLQTLGEGIVERTKRRFETSTDPDGQPWKPNSAATLNMLSARLAGVKSNVKKDGSLNAKGSRALANKKPLIGESGDLRRQIVAIAAGNALTVSSTPVYAAIHQFGGNAGKGHKTVIPARPFLPIKQDGSLYPQEQTLILDALNSYLMEGLQ